MGVLQNLVIRHSIIVILVVTILLQFISCNDSHLDASVGYGKRFFLKNCCSCHGMYDGFRNAPNFVNLSKYDSLTLVEKLRSIKRDSIHNVILHP